MEMVMMVMAPGPADRRRKILDIGELAALRGIGEVRRKLGELSRRCGIAVRRSGLGSGLQVRRDLLRDLLILGWVRLLQLLKGAQQLSEGRKLAVVRL
jgi:hypothetical protein